MPAAPPASAPSHEGFYRQQLDWLRFLAFLAVFMHHALPHGAHFYAAHAPAALVPWLVGTRTAGAFGVDLFFTLSAFLITELLLREQARFGAIDVRAFYMRRLLRIWPLYYSFVALSTVLPETFGAPVEGWTLLSLLGFFANWSFAVRGFPGTAADLLWSVSVEEQFYVALPLALVLVGRTRLWLLALALLAIACTSRVMLVREGVAHPGIWCNTLARLDPIACGMLLAVLHARLPALGRVARSLVIAIALGVIVVCGRHAGLTGSAALFVYPTVALACGALLIAFLSLRPSESSAARALVYLGKISYGLYVFHVLGLSLARLLILPAPATYALGLTLTIAMAAISYRVIEQPALRYKQRFTRIASRG